MTDINRRDCLKQMALGATALALPKLEVLDRRTRCRKRRQQPACGVAPAVDPDPSILNWTVTPTQPDPNAFVTAIFAGLLGFTHDPRPPGVGRVGFHPGHSQSHKPRILVYRIDSSGKCTEHHSPINLDGIKNISLRVMPLSNQPVNYYQCGGPFDRYGGDQYDFRWLPDLDGPDFYIEKYAKYKDHYKHWLEVNNATFYTRMRTQSKFNLVTQDKDSTKPNQLIKHFGFVARYMAAAIPLPAGAQRVELQAGETTIPLSPKDASRFQVIFFNECEGDCPDAQLASSDETLRNDFHHARKVLNLPGERVQIALKLAGPPMAQATPNVCGKEIFLRNTDAAPCLGSGYGGGNGP